MVLGTWTLSRYVPLVVTAAGEARKAPWEFPEDSLSDIAAKVATQHGDFKSKMKPRQRDYSVNTANCNAPTNNTKDRSLFRLVLPLYWFLLDISSTAPSAAAKLLKSGGAGAKNASNFILHHVIWGLQLLGVLGVETFPVQ